MTGVYLSELYLEGGFMAVKVGISNNPEIRSRSKNTPETLYANSSKPILISFIDLDSSKKIEKDVKLHYRHERLTPDQKAQEVFKIHNADRLKKAIDKSIRDPDNSNKYVFASLLSSDNNFENLSSSMKEDDITFIHFSDGFCSVRPEEGEEVISEILDALNYRKVACTAPEKIARNLATGAELLEKHDRFELIYTVNFSVDDDTHGGERPHWKHWPRNNENFAIFHPSRFFDIDCVEEILGEDGDYEFTVIFCDTLIKGKTTWEHSVISANGKHIPPQLASELLSDEILSDSIQLRASEPYACERP